jgi:hypothetical protein
MKYAIATIIAFTGVFAFAHSGGTDSQGCHTNSRTGAYHCH